MTKPKTLNITPTWEGIMPALLALVKQGQQPSAQIAEDEIMRLARLADRMIGENPPPQITFPKR